MAEPAKAAELAAPDDVRFSQNDRSKDPEFALRTEGHNYIGLVLDRCPGGFRIANHLRDRPPRLEGDKLLLELPFGGCARWTGFAVVPGEGSRLPFHLCEDIAHDPCEMNGRKTWVFDIGEALKKNGASAVTYVTPPTSAALRGGGADAGRGPDRRKLHGFVPPPGEYCAACGVRVGSSET